MNSSEYYYPLFLIELSVTVKLHNRVLYVSFVVAVENAPLNLPLSEFTANAIITLFGRWIGAAWRAIQHRGKHTETRPGLRSGLSMDLSALNPAVKSFAFILCNVWPTVSGQCSLSVEIRALGHSIARLTYTHYRDVFVSAHDREPKIPRKCFLNFEFCPKRKTGKSWQTVEINLLMFANSPSSISFSHRPDAGF